MNISVNIERVKDISSLNAYNLCYITDATINFKNGPKLNVDYNGLILWFADNPLTIKGEKVKTNFSGTSQPPTIDREFYLLYIKDFITEDIDGVDFMHYKRDEWLTAHIMYRKANFLNIEMINRGAGCWLYNTNTKDIINSFDTIFDLLNYFKKYQIEIYKINKHVS